MPVARALAALATWPVPTAAGAVVAGGEVAETAGPTDWPTRIASVTKPLVALSALVAVEEGVLDPSEGTGPWIARWEPGASSAESVWRAVR